MGFLATLVSGIAQIASLLIIIRAFMSFFPNIDKGHPIARFIEQTTEPILVPFRNILPTGGMGIDFSPLFAILVIEMASRLVIQMLVTFA